jgi:hypothetical protein
MIADGVLRLDVLGDVTESAVPRRRVEKDAHAVDPSSVHLAGAVGRLWTFPEITSLDQGAGESIHEIEALLAH